ncbi:hypothetical protein IE81DRAFT_126404 [Ceraceosorus guamensis]|uniref:Uncharacterized protein n=1 Tax=Ceraceosorus guamensis TaxID=1522189 RepID=A0A316W7F3_9BASI|nr:hypothetical protein IE81DRAFT_126404 [Ceraceosorus guamensis]PWN45789.1 hypothetical protein IE81DRAFT_126404 [Ceraceosorus guamensis]
MQRNLRFQRRSLASFAQLGWMRNVLSTWCLLGLIFLLSAWIHNSSARLTLRYSIQPITIPSPRLDGEARTTNSLHRRGLNAQLKRVFSNKWSSTSPAASESAMPIDVSLYISQNFPRPSVYLQRQLSKGRFRPGQLDPPAQRKFAEDILSLSPKDAKEVSPGKRLGFSVMPATNMLPASQAHELLKEPKPLLATAAAGELPNSGRLSRQLSSGATSAALHQQAGRAPKPGVSAFEMKPAVEAPSKTGLTQKVYKAFSQTYRRVKKVLGASKNSSKGARSNGCSDSSKCKKTMTGEERFPELDKDVHIPITPSASHRSPSPSPSVSPSEAKSNFFNFKHKSNSASSSDQSPRHPQPDVSRWNFKFASGAQHRRGNMQKQKQVHNGWTSPSSSDDEVSKTKSQSETITLKNKDRASQGIRSDPTRLTFRPTSTAQSRRTRAASVGNVAELREKRKEPPLTLLVKGPDGLGQRSRSVNRAHTVRTAHLTAAY